MINQIFADCIEAFSPSSESLRSGDFFLFFLIFMIIITKINNKIRAITKTTIIPIIINRIINQIGVPLSIISQIPLFY